ncbi:chromate efflux transporter [Geothrix sp. PMB-07]|uniref:chromate efflux transporter n=1 Tax=Geothrix sp. PMB-07 TaxID=3068640 RepID=UPI0027409CC0|nr:chromate efflux transporter [Geothrix sp. PMB-07]WLT31104.1 chromate efflux transporter [Geothrix sp. PMB-07]
MPDQRGHESHPQALPLKPLAGLFLRLGLTAFGGPAAHIAMMEDEVVRRRKWMDHTSFLDLLGLCNLLPGPNSTELAMAIGRAQAGWRGLLLAGLCFIVPASLLTLALAAVYVHYGRLPAAQGFLLGLKPVVLAIVAQAVWNLGRSALRTWRNVLLGVSVLTASLLGLQEALLILGAGALSLLLARPRTQTSAFSLMVLPSTAAAVSLPFTLSGLFWVFLKVGATLFGSGYVLVAFLRTDLVHRLGWLTETQLLDAVAVGQVTPGPVFTTATFIGFLLGSWRGALVATTAIFLPAFLLVALGSLLLPRIRKSPALSAFMNGVNAAAVGLMATALWDLGRATLASPWTILLGLAAAWLLIRQRINPTWVLLGGGLSGYLFHFRA